MIMAYIITALSVVAPSIMAILTKRWEQTRQS